MAGRSKIGRDSCAKQLRRSSPSGGRIVSAYASRRAAPSTAWRIAIPARCSATSPAGVGSGLHWLTTALSRGLKKLASGSTDSLTQQRTKESSMYYLVISQCVQSLKNVETWLNKAERHANLDVGALLNARLAPDMKNFIYQVQSACDYVKAGAAWLSGQTPPKHADTEQTIDELRARVQKTVAFAESVKEAQYAGANKRKVSLSWAP